MATRISEEVAAKANAIKEEANAIKEEANALIASTI
jgi:hypothetical protein